MTGGCGAMAVTGFRLFNDDGYDIGDDNDVGIDGLNYVFDYRKSGRKETLETIAT